MARVEPKKSMFKNAGPGGKSKISTVALKFIANEGIELSTVELIVMHKINNMLGNSESKVASYAVSKNPFKRTLIRFQARFRSGSGAYFFFKTGFESRNSHRSTIIFDFPFHRASGSEPGSGQIKTQN